MENEIIGLILMLVGGVFIYLGGFINNKENIEHSFSDYVLLVIGLALEIIAGFLIPTAGIDY